MAEITNNFFHAMVDCLNRGLDVEAAKKELRAKGLIP